MTWINEKCISFFQWLCIKIIKFIDIEIPRHVAVIMDGNRRFAKRLGINTSDGHSKGFDKLSECLRWCGEVGVKELTVYAFSIENFKRSEEEVTALSALASSKLHLLLESIDKFNEYGVCLRMVGRWSLLSDELRAMAARACLATKGNTVLRLNVAFAYTGRDEISRAASALVDAVTNKELLAEDIDEDLLSQTMDLGDADLLIRTSGEVRLSDFMLWQVQNTVLYFTNTLWPEFTFYGFLASMIHFHLHTPAGKIMKENNERKNMFLDNLDERRWHGIEKIVNIPIAEGKLQNVLF